VGANLGHVSVQGTWLVAEHLLVLLIGHSSIRAGVGQAVLVLGILCLHEIDVVLESLRNVTVALSLDSLELCPLLLISSGSSDCEDAELHGASG